MRRSLMAGLLLAVGAALIIGLGDALGFGLDHVALMGAALGGVLGLVPGREPLGKLAGFVVGFVVAWLGFALRAAVLPDTAGGRATAAFLVVAVIAVCCAVSGGRVPLWSALLGAAAIVGAYEETYTNAPSEFLRQSPTAGTTVLLAVALGYLATSLVRFPEAVSAGADADDRPDRPDHPRDADHTGRTGVDALLAGENK